MEPRIPFVLDPLPATFGAMVSGLRLAALSEPDFVALHRAWLDYGLLIFCGQNLSPDQQVAFARRFGALEFPMLPISNVRPDGAIRPPQDDWMQVVKGNLSWHCDSTYMPIQSKGSVFSAKVVPPAGGETEWADMAAAYDALPPPTQAQLQGLSARHSMKRSQALIGHDYRRSEEVGGYGSDVTEPPLRPLVKIHPDTGRPALMIGRHAYDVTGMDEAASDAFLAALTQESCQPPRVWRHSWTAGDVVVWDNRRLMHRGRPWDMSQPRVMHHSRIAGDPRTEFAPPG